MQAFPSLTVLMTVYNGMPYLAEAVRSVLSQDLKDFTFLVLNNGSTDGTRAFLEETQERHGSALPRLRFIHLPENIGRTAVLNKALALVETELTAILDADDLALSGRLSAQAAFLRDNPDIDLLGADVVYLDGNGNCLGKDSYPPAHRDLLNRLPLYNQFAHSACVYKTGAARDAGGYSREFPYAQDLALWIAMLTRGAKAASLPKALSAVRTHPGQATRDLSLLMVRREDNYKLAQAMLAIPSLSRVARQTARLRSAGALYSLGRKKEALFEGWRAVLENPFGLIINPLLWQRALLQLKRGMPGLLGHRRQF